MKPQTLIFDFALEQDIAAISQLLRRIGDCRYVAALRRNIAQRVQESGKMQNHKKAGAE